MKEKPNIDEYLVTYLLLIVVMIIVMIVETQKG